MAIQTHSWSALDERQRRAGTAAIIDEVRRTGDAALRRLTAEYDRADIRDLRVSGEELDRAETSLTPEQLDAIDLAIDNVGKFHRAQIQADIRVETMPGVLCERVSVCSRHRPDRTEKPIRQCW
jgi:histidinol dehydrogenase